MHTLDDLLDELIAAVTAAERYKTSKAKQKIPECTRRIQEHVASLRASILTQRLDEVIEEFANYK